MKKDNSILKMKEISTGHMCAVDSYYLDGCKEKKVTPEFPFLWHTDRGYVFSTMSPKDMRANRSTMPFSSDLIRVLSTAYRQGCSYVHFDGDAHVDPKLQLFDW